MRNPKKEIEDIERFEEILKIVSEEGFQHLLSEANLTRHLPLKSRAKNRKKSGPERLEETIERLGTTFIKFGQIMSERPDIVPQRYFNELENLQDSVSEFDHEKAKSIVDEEVGLDNFEEFQNNPIAAASIAQVHRAKLENGDDVVVKVRRPGIKEEVEKDLEIMEYISKKLEKHSSKMKDLRISKLVEEFANWTKKELDFENEASNAQIFQKNLEEENKLKVPDVYPELTTEKVITLDYMEGVKVNNSEALEEMNVEANELAKTTVRAGFKQVVRDGFFHADPHPSNFLIQEEGKIVYLDFGMMGRISRRYRDQIDLLFLYALREEPSKALDALLEMGWTREDADLKKIEMKIDEKAMNLQNSSIGQTRISEEFLDLFIFAGHHGLHLPLQLTLMAKNMLTLEGIGLTVCPDFKPTDEYQEIGKKILVEKNKPKKLADEAFLDLASNKDMISQPFSTLKENLSSNNNSRNKTEVQNRIQFGSLPIFLILTSAVLIISSVIDQIFMYIGVLELILGIYLYGKK